MEGKHCLLGLIFLFTNSVMFSFLRIIANIFFMIPHVHYWQWVEMRECFIYMGIISWISNLCVFVFWDRAACGLKWGFVGGICGEHSQKNEYHKNVIYSVVGVGELSPSLGIFFCNVNIPWEGNRHPFYCFCFQRGLREFLKTNYIVVIFMRLCLLRSRLIKDFRE